MNRSLALLLVVLVSVATQAQDEVPAPALLGDYRDGGACPHVHHLALYDAQGFRIFPGVNDDRPFSLRVTCGACHDVGTIGGGWHFARRPVTGTGRPGEPWIYWDATLATQIPLTLRPGSGSFEPNQIGLSAWTFIQAFGRQLPGGQVTRPADDDLQDPGDRWEASGDFEINCLACHNAASAQDQSQAAEQTGLQNYAWVPTATSDLADVSGSVKQQARTWEEGALGQDGPQVTYDASRFLADHQVSMDIRRAVPNQRCLFCHSSTQVPSHGIDAEKDVHLAAGMACVDCHRNGLDHAMVRGYEGEAVDTNEPLRAAFSCRGCHLGTGAAPAPTAGRLTAPRPLHQGIPPIHFDRLSCTACHSGPWPGPETTAVKTSRAHALGTRRVNRTDETLPHIQTPIFAVDVDGRIAPHHLIWPAYWGWLRDETVTPASLDKVRTASRGILPHAYSLTTSSWPALELAQIGQVLRKLDEQAPNAAVAVYVSGGKLYRRDGDSITATAHSAAAPVTWPIGHNVRPAQQSLGVRSCQDCHDTEGGMLFGRVAVDGPLVDPNETVAMAQFHGLDPSFNRLFAQSFVFRPWMKLVCGLACVVLLGVLLAFGFRALYFVVMRTS